MRHAHFFLIQPKRTCSTLTSFSFAYAWDTKISIGKFPSALTTFRLLVRMRDRWVIGESMERGYLTRLSRQCVYIGLSILWTTLRSQQCRVDMPHLEWPLFWLGPVALGHALHWYLTPPFRLGWIMLPANLGTALRDLSRKLPSDPVICFHHRTTHGTGDCSCFRTKSLASNTDAEGLRKGKKKRGLS